MICWLGNCVCQYVVALFMQIIYIWLFKIYINIFFTLESFTLLINILQHTYITDYLYRYEILFVYKGVVYCNWCSPWYFCGWHHMRCDTATNLSISYIFSLPEGVEWQMLDDTGFIIFLGKKDNWFDAKPHDTKNKYING